MAERMNFFHGKAYFPNNAAPALPQALPSAHVYSSK